LQNKVKVQDQGHKVKSFGAEWKVSSWGTYMWNISILSLIIQKI
jgi:hypothetical protein